MGFNYGYEKKKFDSRWKTWGELCGARVKRRCGVMTAAPAETGMSQSPGVRGKCGE